MKKISILLSIVVISTFTFSISNLSAKTYYKDYGDCRVRTLEDPLTDTKVVLLKCGSSENYAGLRCVSGYTALVSLSMEKENFYSDYVRVRYRFDKKQPYDSGKDEWEWHKKTKSALSIFKGSFEKQLKNSSTLVFGIEDKISSTGLEGASSALSDFNTKCDAIS